MVRLVLSRNTHWFPHMHTFARFLARVGCTWTTFEKSHKFSSLELPNVCIALTG